MYKVHKGRFPLENSLLLPHLIGPTHDDVTLSRLCGVWGITAGLLCRPDDQKEVNWDAFQKNHTCYHLLEIHSSSF
jgi:hypothetical protein